MSKYTVLVSGGGIAGPVAGFWLARAGMKVTIVERAPEPRSAGQGIDIRGAALEVVKRMGLEELIRSRTTNEKGLAFVDKNGKAFAEFPVDGVNGQSFTSDIEILRGELSKIFLNASKDKVEYIFDDSITSIDDDGGKVNVSFAKGAKQAFDIVIGADGMRSKTRRLAFPHEPDPMKSLGQYTSFFAIPRIDSDTDWARWYNAPGGRGIIMRPDNNGSTRVYLSIMSTEPAGYENLDITGQKRIYHRLFADAGWEVPRMLAGMDHADDFYMQEIAQVIMKSWSKGRVALLGDAGYCPSPISGMGTSLAIVGAYVLAGELQRCGSPEEAFRAYEVLMRPFVEQVQKLPPGAPGIANPQTWWGIWIFNTVLSLVTKTGLAGLLGRFSLPHADKIELPVYDM